jgi:lipopolysaccharide/colanic/teichoic acid biosynthesis glycosyltransferase
VGKDVRSRRVAHVATVDLSLRFLLLPQLLALRDAGFDVTAISAPGPWVPELEAQGIRHVAWTKVTRSWNPEADLSAFRELLAILRRGRFDLVHTHNPKPGVMGRIAARLAGTPAIVNTVHGLYATPDDRFARRAPVLTAEWIAARFSHLELYQSAEDLRWARHLRIARPGRAAYLGNGIDLDTFRPAFPAEGRVRELRAEFGVGEGQLIVGTVGRMVREKGYRELFEAAAIVQRRVADVRFLVVGERDRDKADAITTEEVERAGDRFIFAGWREDVSDLMRVMDLFVLPSWREGLPRSAIEAAATGLPLVLTDIRGCREVISDGIEGLLVPARDVLGLATAITTLLEQPGPRAGMGRAARARAEASFDERRVTQTVVRETERLLDVSKRVFDVAVAGSALVVLSPILGAVAVGVRIWLGKPVLFRQVRPGWHGEPFTILKFRTMRTVHGPDGKPLPDEMRMTGFGSALRSMSVDELPELWNVLRGDMSLVGPRPLLMQYMDRYTAEQNRRHDVRPGITGLAQVSGRNELTWEEKFELDTWYVDHRSFGLDFRILMKTLKLVVTGRGVNQPGARAVEEFRGAD